MTVAVNDIIRATAVMNGIGGRVENVFQFRANAVLDGSDLACMHDIASKLDEIYTFINSDMASSLAYIEVRGHNITQNQPMPTVPWPALVNGGGSAADMPAGVALFALLRTGISRVLGRKFLGGYSSGVLDGDGAFSGAALLHAVAFLGGLVGSFLGSETLNSWLPGVKSKAGVFWAFVEGVASANPGYQRRRRLGRGE